MFTTEEIFEAFCKILINSTGITDDMNNSIGTGLYLGLSAVDHSCAPNVNVVFNGNMVELRAMEDIPDPMWANVRVDYLSIIQPRQLRQSQLLRDYFFTCSCKLCNSSGEEFLISVICDKCSAGVAVSRGKCDACQQDIRSDYQQLSEIFHHELDNKQLISTYKRLVKIFHISDYRMIEFGERVMSACISENEFETLLEVAEHLLQSYREYYHCNSLSLGHHVAKLGKTAIYLNKSSEAHKYLQECLKIFKLSHGEGSLMYSYICSLRDSL